METTTTFVFAANKAVEAANFTVAVGGKMDQQGEVFVVTCSAGAAAKYEGMKLLKAAKNGSQKTVAATGTLAVGAIELASQTAGIVYEKAAKPVIKKAAEKTGEAIKTGFKDVVIGGAKGVVMVHDVKEEVTDVYNNNETVLKAREILTAPKDINVFGLFTIRRGK